MTTVATSSMMTSRKKSSKPLAGLCVLVTRDRRQAPALSQMLRSAGASVIEVPVIEIVPPRSCRALDTALRELPNVDWLILTSVNGVEAMLRRMTALRISVAALRHMKVAAIGPATRAALEKRKIKVSVVPREFVAESVAAALRARVRGKSVLLVRAARARDVLPAELRAAGARVKVVAAYETKVPLAAPRQIIHVLKKKTPHLVTCTSSSTVQNFLRLAKPLAPAKTFRFASIGPITTSMLKNYGITPAVQAQQFTMNGLVKAIVSWRRKNPLPSRARGGVHRNR